MGAPIEHTEVIVMSTTPEAAASTIPENRDDAGDERSDTPDLYRAALTRAHEHALRWLDSVPTRRVAPSVDADELDKRFAGPIPESPTDAAAVVDELVAMCEPGLMDMPSGRFFGWVIGGTLPAALATDWMVSAWDQNAAMRFATPATAAIEGVAGRWLLDLLHLPAGSGVGFTTGGTMANFVGLAAGRKAVLDAVGWDLHADGLTGAPRLAVFVGEERHASVDLALRYLGLGTPTAVASDAEGRIIPESLAEAMDRFDGPSIVCLQAGNLHSGAFDPMRESIRIAHEHGAWVHVDGAFGLWAAASPLYEEALDGLDGADSWATDAHKTLNVPYDCGVAIVARPELLQAAFGLHTNYIIQVDHAAPDPFEKVPEMSRRARELPVWAALRSLGRSGAVALVEGLAANARTLAERLGALPGVEVLNDVVFTQVCLAFGSDDRTRRVTRHIIGEGAVWMSGSRWQDRDILRISVSNWSTDADDIAACVAAVRRAIEAEPA
jgi:glutamate/tyrosine decarboxylase-like PLP-dependent enzyme